MKKTMAILIIGTAASIPLFASVPIRWNVPVGSVREFKVSAFHGETLEIEAALYDGGKPFSKGLENPVLCYQTNGMGAAWWTAPAMASNNVLRATWTPRMDVGADRYTCFIGATGANWRTAFTLSMRHSPGFVPNVLPPPTMFEDMVAAIVTNETTVGWRWELHPDFVSATDPVFRANYDPWGNFYSAYWSATFTMRDGYQMPADMPCEEHHGDRDVVYFDQGTAYRIKGNALGLAKREDLKGKADASVTNDIEELKSESTLIYRLFSGSNIVMEVTNYNSRANPPAMKLERLNDRGEYETMWTETNGLERTYNRAASNTAEQVAALERKAAETYAPRGWSATTSGLGADAPKDVTWISTPQTVIAGGLEFQKTLTASGQLWFLRSNGMMAEMGEGAKGFFEIAAADGTPLFSIERTDSYLAGADADSISAAGNTVTLRLSVVAAEHPLLRYAPSLDAPVAWQKEEDGFSSPIGVSWRGGSGAWECVVVTSAARGFFTFEFLQEGLTKIKSGGAMDVSTGGILCTDGIHKCRPVYNSNGAITWEAF